MFDDSKLDVQRRLFDRFNSIVIEDNKPRDSKSFNLPDEDLKHCEKIQKEFDIIIENLRDFKALYQSIKAEEDKLEKYNHFEMMSDALLYFPSVDFEQKEKDTKQSFIFLISQYFYKKYNLKDIDFSELLKLENLSYKNLVDKIFSEFGDIVNRGITNLKNDFRQHFVRFRAFDEPIPPKLNKNKISLKNHCRYNANYNYTKFFFENDNKGYNVLRRVLLYFETGDITEEKELNLPKIGYKNWIEFSGPYELNLKKIKAVKFFKNYRLDITFNSSEYAKEFFDMFEMAHPIDERRR